MQTYVAAALLATTSAVVADTSRQLPSAANESALFEDPPPRTILDRVAIYSQTIDLGGNDLWHKQPTDAFACYNTCYDDIDCGGYTWTRYNGGTCWFKGKSNPVDGRPATEVTFSFLLLDYKYWGIPPPMIKDGCDLVGQDISNVRGANVHECASKCHQDASCGKVTWTNYNGGTCWLKGLSPQACTDKAGTYSAFIFREWRV